MWRLGAGARETWSAVISQGKGHRAFVTLRLNERTSQRSSSACVWFMVVIML